jgi:hypothetical protein
MRIAKRCARNGWRIVVLIISHSLLDRVFAIPFLGGALSRRSTRSRRVYQLLDGIRGPTDSHYAAPAGPVSKFPFNLIANRSSGHWFGVTPVVMGGGGELTPTHQTIWYKASSPHPYTIRRNECVQHGATIYHRPLCPHDTSGLSRDSASYGMIPD